MGTQRKAGIVKALAIAVAFGCIGALGAVPENEAITSVETAPPVVVTTSPAAGAADVDPETTEIRATFSKDMQDGNWSFVRIDKETYPATTGDPRFDDDHRTVVLPVKLEPGKTYVIWLNKPPYTSFMDTEGRRAVPYLLVFQTRE